MDQCVGAAARLPESDRKDLAVLALARSATVSELAVRHGVSRKFVYQQTHKARVALDDAFTATMPDDAMLFELTVSKTWLRQVIVGLALICHSSYRGIVEFLRDLLGVAISVGTVHDVLQSATQQAGAINQEQDLSGIRVGLHDEIFHGGKPVLAGVDAHSTYCYLLAAESHRDADPWGVHLLDAARQGLRPAYTIADAGQGLRAGQRAAWGETPCHGDIFHIQRQCEGLANTLSRLAKGATSRRERVQAKIDRICQQHPNDGLVAQLAPARQAEINPGDLAGPRHPNTDPLAKPRCSGVGRTAFGHAANAVRFHRRGVGGSRARGSPAHPPTARRTAESARQPARVRRRARHETDRHRASPCDRRTGGAGSLPAASPAQHLGRILAALEPASREVGRQVPQAVRCRQPGDDANPAQQLVGGEPELATAHYFTLRRHLGSSYLGLLQFYLNHHCFIRSRCAERQGKSPREVMTGQRHPHWLTLLGLGPLQPQRA